MTHTLLPLHLSLSGRAVVVVGGGPVAWRKASGAMEAGALVQVIAPYLCDEFAEAAGRGEVEWRERDYRSGDLHGSWLAFAATGDSGTDSAVEADADVERIFCVRASVTPADRTGTRSPAVLRRGSVVVSVSTTTGADPGRAKAIRDALATVFDSGRLPLRRRRSGPGRVTLVGGGPGAGDLLTLRARRALAEADVVVVDRLAPREVLDELGPGVQVIEVGKAAGHHFASQTEINHLLVEHAQAGRQVVRLKGGDPYVFGRGGEEMAACREAGVDVSVIPGVSSAFAVPLAAGIPVTHRGVARQVTVVTGHDQDGVAALNWPVLAAGGGTLVVLMGVAALGTITRGLQDSGLSGDTPVAIVENGCLPDQRVTTARLADIAGHAGRRCVQAPAVIVIGEVAAFARETDGPPGEMTFSL